MRGAVQGVGFRPFVFRLAKELKLAGWVNNSPQGVFIEVEGPRAALEKFLRRLESEKPPRSFIQSLESSWLDAVGFKNFEIRASETGGDKTALVLPDIATCPDCLREIFDPKNRRHRYPFTNCTNCGPRFSIIEVAALRPREHLDEKIRDVSGVPGGIRRPARPPLSRAAECLSGLRPAIGILGSGVRQNADFRRRKISRALPSAATTRCLPPPRRFAREKLSPSKALADFICWPMRATKKPSSRLRERKHREEKPFALMFPSLESVKAVCEVSPLGRTAAAFARSADCSAAENREIGNRQSPIPWLPAIPISA